MADPVCFVCGETQAFNNPAATPFRGHPGYGSRLDGSTAGNEPLEIHVCDDCLVANAERVELRKTETRTVAHIKPWLCQDCLRPRHCGTCAYCTHAPTDECPMDECMVCGTRDCPTGEPLHYHHDGCPECSKEP